MIKVIKNGNQHYIATCDKCGCVFTFDKVDVKEIIWTSDGNEYDIHCPQCGKSIVTAGDPVLE